MKQIIIALVFSNIIAAQSNIPIEVANGFQGQLYDLALNNNFVYASAISSPNSIIRVNLNTPNQPEVFISNIVTPIGITIDDNFLYIVESIPTKISRVNLTIPNPALQLLPISFVGENDYPWSVKVYDNELYYSFAVMNIKKVSVNNFSQTPINLVSFTGSPHDFIKDGNFIYTVETSIDPSAYPDRIIKLNLLDTFPPEPTQIVAITEPKSIVKFQNYLFVGDNGKKIYRINLNLANPVAELFYEAPGNDNIGKIKLYNNEIYFPYVYEGSNQTALSKILKFSQAALSNNDFSPINPISVFPNPAQNFINIQTQETIIEATVYDMLGKKVITNQLSTNSLDVSKLSKGMYIIKVVTEDSKSFSSKFIKK